MKSSQLIAFAILVTVLPTSAIAKKSEDVHLTDKAFIRNAVTKMEAAYAAGDADGYVLYTDPNFVNVDLSGKETTHGKEERHQNMIAMVSKATNLGAKITGHSTVRSITFSSDGATVIEESYSTYSANINGQARILKDHSVYRDFWVKSSTGWLEKRSRTVSSKKTLNGQSLP